MARITVEDCLKAGYNKFSLVHLTTKRVFQLRKGKQPLISTSNKEVVAALREIAAGKVWAREGNNLLANDLEKESESPDEADSKHIDEDEDLLEMMNAGPLVRKLIKPTNRPNAIDTNPANGAVMNGETSK